MPDPSVTPATPAREPFEVIGARKKTEPWLLKCCAAYARWAKGREVTEAEFDETVEKVNGVRLSSFPP